MKRLSSNILLHQEKRPKFNPMRTTDGEPVTPLCRSYPKAQAWAAIPDGTLVGPVLKVHVVKILDGYGIEVAIPSVAHPMKTSYVVTSRSRALCE